MLSVTFVSWLIVADESMEDKKSAPRKKESEKEERRGKEKEKDESKSKKKRMVSNSRRSRYHSDDSSDEVCSFLILIRAGMT